MNTNRNTDQLFQHMRSMPVDVPLENVEKFVVAQAALGITTVGASKGIFTKAFLKFHLNSIIIMTTTITAALVSIFLWTSHGDKVSAQTNSNNNSKFEFSSAALIPEIKMETDSPKVVTTTVVKDGETITVTKIQTETGTNIKVITNGNNQTSVYYNTTNDSAYTFAYASSDDESAIPPIPAIPPVPAVPSLYSYNADAPNLLNCCNKPCFDSLTSILGKALLKDGLISDTAQYSFKINGTSLTVNGKKQNKEQWRKYKEIIEKNSYYRIHPFMIFTINRDDNNTTVKAIDSTEPIEPMQPMQPMQPMEPVSFAFSNSFQSCNDTLMSKLEKSLLKDGLISDTMHYTFKINGSYMKVDGVKMNKDQWKKYKGIIEGNSKNKVNEDFSYAIRKDGEDLSINVENFVD